MKNTSRQQQKEQTREALLQAAYDVFARGGITAARMSDVAAAAGVSHGTVFVHFPTQEALITEVIDMYGSRIALRTHELAGSHEGMAQLLRAHLAGIAEFELFYTRLVIENRLLPPAARDVWIGIQSAISFHFSQIAAREAQAGRIIAHPAHLLFNTWVGLVHYYLANGDLFAPEGNVIARYGDTLVESFLRLIGTDRAGEA